jgi:putative transposase
MVSPATRRRALGALLAKGVSRRLGCRVVGLSRNASRCERKDRRPELRSEVLKLSRENPRYGFRRVHTLLGPGVNLKAVHRIWREEGLSLRTRKRRRIEVEKKNEPVPTRFGEVWSVDFASEWLENRRQARIVGLLDVATRENLLLKAQPSIRAHHLVKELSWLFLVHGKPKKIRFDNGPEFRSRKLTKFLEEQGVEAGFIEPGSPWQNGHTWELLRQAPGRTPEHGDLPHRKGPAGAPGRLPGPLQPPSSPLRTRRADSRDVQREDQDQNGGRGSNTLGGSSIGDWSSCCFRASCALP